MKALIDELMKVDAFGGRVYPVTLPQDKQVWPACVVARDGGAEMGVLGEGEGEKLRAVRIEVLDVAEEYERLDGIMREVEARVDRLSYGLIDPPDDIWNETLGVVQQSIRVVLLP